MMLQNGNQQIYLQIGRSGCYFMCLIRLCENITGEPIDIADAYRRCLESGMIKENCYVNNPTAILHLFTNQNFEVLFLGNKYKDDGCDYVIAHWEYKDGKEVKSHFTISVPSNPKWFEPYGNSIVCQKGKIVDYRVFKSVYTKKK